MRQRETGGGMMSALSLVFLTSAVFVAPALAGAPETLCVYGEVDSQLSAKVAAPVVDLRPAAIHQKVDRLSTRELDDLYGYIRGLKGGWETPKGVWPKDATVIEVNNRSEVVCQVIYDKNNLYVAVVKNTGFLRRKLSTAEHEELDRKVPTIIYDLVEPSPPDVSFRSTAPEDSRE